MYVSVKENFLNDVKDHKMEVLLNDGNRRHLKFKKDGSLYDSFDLLTWNGYLLITGDRGSWLFKRDSNMFNFFGYGIKEDGELKINPNYWSEKLEAVDKCSSLVNFSYSKFIDSIKEHASYELNDNELEDFIKYIDEEDPMGYISSNEEAHMFLNSYVFGWESGEELKTLQFQDTFEWDFTEFNYNYLWCLYAIVYAIKLYRENLK